MMNLPQIRDFQIRFENGQVINELIENIEELATIIRVYRRELIVKISFYFHTSSHTYHNLILRKDEYSNNDKFIVEFYHSYNRNREIVELSPQEQLQDYEAVINVLQNNDKLNNLLVPYIINPFN